jgi:WhiB family redox-sensing transcriptional regulator
VDPELFFPTGSGEAAMDQEAQAKQICHRCPSMLDCREWAAMSMPRVDGVWGGLSQVERERTHRRALRRGRVDEPVG